MPTGFDRGKPVEDLQASVSLPVYASDWVSEAPPKRQVKDAYDEIK